MNHILKWSIENATNSAGHTRTRPGCWAWFWTGMLCGLAFSGLISVFI